MISPLRFGTSLKSTENLHKNFPGLEQATQTALAQMGLDNPSFEPSIILSLSNTSSKRARADISYWHFVTPLAKRSDRNGFISIFNQDRFESAEAFAQRVAQATRWGVDECRQTPKNILELKIPPNQTEQYASVELDLGDFVKHPKRFKQYQAIIEQVLEAAEELRGLPVEIKLEEQIFSASLEASITAKSGPFKRTRLKQKPFESPERFIKRVIQRSQTTPP